MQKVWKKSAQNSSDKSGHGNQTCGVSCRVCSQIKACGICGFEVEFLGNKFPVLIFPNCILNLSVLQTFIFLCEKNASVIFWVIKKEYCNITYSPIGGNNLNNNNVKLHITLNVRFQASGLFHQFLIPFCIKMLPGNMSIRKPTLMLKKTCVYIIQETL